MRKQAPKTNPHRAAREAAGITQDALARVVGVSFPTIQRCMREGRPPQNRLARKRYLAALGLPDPSAPVAKRTTTPAKGKAVARD
jgi:DNA-binding XRE family transcriptional regulator